MSKWKFSIWMTLLTMTVFILMSQSKMGDYVEAHFSSSFQYQVRNYLKEYPKLSSKVKILVFDDAFISYLNRANISMEEWYKVLWSIQQKKPKKIFIDKIFGYIAKDDQDAIKKIKDLNAPVGVGGMGTDHEIPNKTPLNVSAEGYSAKSFYELPETEPSSHYKSIYGPHYTVRDAFRNVGHIVYEGVGFYKPYYRYDDSHVFPHLSFYTDSEAELYSDRLKSGGTTVYFDRNGMLPYNFGPISYYQQKSFGMTAAYQEAVMLGRASSLVQEGDIVIILPLMFTGNSDWIPTPIGKIPGGFLLAASFQSMFSGEFIHKLDRLSIPIIIVFAVLGLLSGVLLSFVWFWWFQITTMVITIALCFYAFIYHSYMIPWIYGVATFFICGLVSMIKKTFLGSLVRQRMEQELATAKIVQQYFFKQSNIDNLYLTGDVLYKSAYECSGDWWYFKNHGHIDYALIGDVMGHGTSAALVTAIIHSNITGQLQKKSDVPLSPKSILQRLNTTLFEILNGKVSASMLALMIDHKNKTISVANAGHNFPFIMNAVENKIKGVIVKGAVLGISEDPVFQEKEIKYDQNLRVFTYTDGLIENSNDNIKNITRLKLKKELQKNLGNSCEQMHKNIVDFAKGIHQVHFNEDDITMMSFELKSNIVT